MHQASLIGYVGARDAELKETQNGKKFLSFSMAVTINRREKESAWYDVTVWNESYAEMLAQRVKAKSPITVIGRMTGVYAREKNGSISVNHKISADAVQVSASAPSGQQEMSSGWGSKPSSGGGSQGGWGQQQGNQGGWGNSGGSDPIPF
ncbi:MAG: single-stranded DNA-binding protein [Actinomycetota bacterium]|nr:single-stranded DNA-binding protein [Actinomycetota bacterium]